MRAARHRAAQILAADPRHQPIHLFSGFLHQQNVRLLPLDQPNNIVERGSGEAEQVPADELDHYLHQMGLVSGLQQPAFP